MSKSENVARAALVNRLTEILKACGLNARAWRDQRIYLSGYGRDITAYLEPSRIDDTHPADHATLFVRSNWNMPKLNGLRCKGVKHAILKDLYAARLLSAPPPLNWKDVPLEGDGTARSALRPFEPENYRTEERQNSRNT